MSGDYSRNSFDPAKQFSLVRLQQGRLLTDADFNEQGDLLRHDHRRAATDIIGPAGFAQDDAGFALSFNAALGGFVVGGGSAYVQGRHVRSLGTRALTIRRKSGTGTDTRWIAEQGPALQVGDVLALTADGSGAVHRVTHSEANSDGEAEFRLDPSLTPQSTTAAWLLEVTDPADAPLPAAPGRYLAYLAAWDAAITALDDPALLEVAFDGPDTATRDMTRWQVRFIAEAELVARGLATAPLTCADVDDGVDLDGERARLAARATISATETGPCTLPPESGYRSIENHLYRVEIHVAPGIAAPHYKWSRDNAMHRARYDLIEDGALVVDSLGRDEVTKLKVGDWIEIRDDAALAANRGGFFALIGDISGQRLILSELRSPDDLSVMTAAGEPNLAALPPRATVQRWEGGLPVEADPALGWVALELGVEIRFQPGAMLHGDSWTIPARALTGDVEWPQHPVTGDPLDLAPQGLDRGYAPLAIVERGAGGSWTVLSDCRPIFAPLTDQLQFDYVSGDGQEAMPDETAPATLVALGQPLMVAATRGRLPVAGVGVRFTVTLGDGRLTGNVTTLDTFTQANGIASVTWSVDGASALQRVTAIRIDADGNPLGTMVEFAANLSRARDTSFDPSATPELAGALTVQDAIEQLARIQHGGCETHVITPANDWIKVLAAIPAKADVSICFAPGTYSTDKTVKLAGLGHVKINGSGDGVRIVATHSECALEVAACASLVVRGLSVRSVALRGAMVDASQTDHRLGALTVSGVQLVDIADCDFACAPDHDTRHTALTVRTLPEDTKATPTARVRIANCRCEVGHMQEGMLVHDAIDTLIADNSLSVQALRSDFDVGSEKLPPKRRDQLLGTLVARLTAGRAVLGDDIREIRAGDLSYTFMSAVPQAEWDKLVCKDPPPATVRTEESFRKYLTSLFDKVTEQPDLLPSFDEGIRGLGMGSPTGADRDTRRKMLTLREIGIASRRDKLRGDRNVMIEMGGQTVAFTSPVRDSEWTRILARAEETAPFDKSQNLADYVRQAAVLLLDGTMARTNFKEFNAWFAANTRQRSAMAFQGIVCAGRRLDSVRVTGNVIRGFNTAVRIAVSHERESMIVGDAVIEDNLCELTTPGNDVKWLQGIYVGNIDRLLVRGNRLLHLKTPGHHNTRFEFGVWVYGFLGHRLLFKENHIELARIGFRVKKLVQPAPPMPEEQKRDYLWVYADNYVKDGQMLDLTSPDKIARRRDNIV